jgi:hypothetical protein
MAPLAATPGTGLKVPSVVRFDKLATLDRAVIAGKIGDAPAEWLASHRTNLLRGFWFWAAVTRTKLFEGNAHAEETFGLSFV